MKRFSTWKHFANVPSLPPYRADTHTHHPPSAYTENHATKYGIAVKFQKSGVTPEIEKKMAGEVQCSPEIALPYHIPFLFPQMPFCSKRKGNKKYASK